MDIKIHIGLIIGIRWLTELGQGGQHITFDANKAVKDKHTVRLIVCTVVCTFTLRNKWSKNCHWDGTFQKAHLCTSFTPKGCILVPERYILLPNVHILVPK